MTLRLTAFATSLLFLCAASCTEAASCAPDSARASSPCCNLNKFTQLDQLGYNLAQQWMLNCYARGGCDTCASDIQKYLDQFARFYDQYGCWENATALSPGGLVIDQGEPRNIHASRMAIAACNTLALPNSVVSPIADVKNSCLNLWRAYTPVTAASIAAFARLQTQLTACDNPVRCPICGECNPLSQEEAAANQALLVQVVSAFGASPTGPCWGKAIARQPSEVRVNISTRNELLRDVYCASCDLEPIVGPNPPSFECFDTTPSPLNLTVPFAVISGVLLLLLIGTCVCLYQQRRKWGGHTQTDAYQPVH